MSTNPYCYWHDRCRLSLPRSTSTTIGLFLAWRSGSKGVTARSQESATAFAEEHSLEAVYPTAEALFADEEITVVDLCVPNYLHYPLTVQAAEAGKHIICEKPLTGYFGDGGGNACGTRDTPDDQMFEAALKAADEMVDAVKRNGVTFCYGENWVHAPSVQKANDILAQSENTILRIIAEESHSGSHSDYAKEWRYSGGGALYNKGCHPVGANTLSEIQRRGAEIRETHQT